jgi:hypothetical protein
MDDWGFEDVPVPADGSCFFSSISIAMNDSMAKWMGIPPIRDMMEHHWERFNRMNEMMGIETNPDRITQRFIRYMSASAMDDVSLEMYNEDARCLRKKRFDTPEELARHVLNSNCWADQSMIRTFMRSTQYMVCVVLLDRRTSKPIFAPREWTFNKPVYICVQLHGNHYTPLRLNYRGSPLDMCVSRREIRCLMSALSTEYDFEGMY